MKIKMNKSALDSYIYQTAMLMLEQMTSSDAPMSVEAPKPKAKPKKKVSALARYAKIQARVPGGIKGAQGVVNSFFGNGTVEEDGRYGPKTHRAIKKLQKTIGAKPDGIMGRKTIAKMKQYRANRNTAKGEKAIAKAGPAAADQKQRDIEKRQRPEERQRFRIVRKVMAAGGTREQGEMAAHLASRGIDPSDAIQKATKGKISDSGSQKPASPAAAAGGEAAAAEPKTKISSRAARKLVRQMTPGQKKGYLKWYKSKTKLRGGSAPESNEQLQIAKHFLRKKNLQEQLGVATSGKPNTPSSIAQSNSVGRKAAKKVGKGGRFEKIAKDAADKSGGSWWEDELDWARPSDEVDKAMSQGINMSDPDEKMSVPWDPNRTPPEEKKKKPKRNPFKSLAARQQKLIDTGKTGGVDLKQIQKALGLTPDGKYGPKTYRAIRAFQKKTGTKPDGLVGGFTMSQLRKKFPAIKKKSDIKGGDLDATDKGHDNIQKVADAENPEDRKAALASLAKSDPKAFGQMLTQFQEREVAARKAWRAAVDQNLSDMKKVQAYCKANDGKGGCQALLKTVSGNKKKNVAAKQKYLKLKKQVATMKKMIGKGPKPGATQSVVTQRPVSAT